MDERLKIKELIARLGDSDGLERPTTDKVPISAEEDYVLKEIARVQGFATRAKTWRWLLANYAKFEWADRAKAAFDRKVAVDAEFALAMARSEQ